MPSRFDRWKAWLQLVLRANQYDGASDSSKKNFAIWSKIVRLDPTMMVSTEPNCAQPQWGCQEGESGFGLSRDQLFNKLRWSVDGGIDYFKCDADVNASVVTQNFLMVKNGGAEFWEENKLQSDCHRVVWAFRGCVYCNVVCPADENFSVEPT